ncbi:hypothetical protein DMC30DRAFT_406707 [Rhodotorula diobovata]|uniref:Uncharacterized protein n=1 Tax=Rhodotorula diobovata TaxID=5288 RepID=A0A5C5FMP2_9BASI|nr:hypothetical protein DMC30DRAFT_406707 [Rhodotorula diobovata]
MERSGLEKGVWAAAAGEQVCGGTRSANVEVEELAWRGEARQTCCRRPGRGRGHAERVRAGAEGGARRARMVGVLLLVRPGASALCCVPPAHPPSLDPPFDGGDGEGEGEGTRRRGALGPRRPPSVLPPLREPSAPRRSSPRSSIVHAAPPSGPPSGRRPHPSSALLFPPVSRFQSSRALADSRRPLLSLLPTAVISPTSPRAMSNAPPSDALSEGSYWIAELSGVPAGVAIDHLSEPPFTWGKLYGAQWIAKKEANLRSTALGFKNWDELLVALHGLNGISMAKWKSVIGTSVSRREKT